jgi:hypothetical protein
MIYNIGKIMCDINITTVIKNTKLLNEKLIDCRNKTSIWTIGAIKLHLLWILMRNWVGYVQANLYRILGAQKYANQ